MTAGDFVFFFVLVARFKTFSLLFQIFIIFLYMAYYVNVSSYYSVVLLKQTTELKTLPNAHVTQFHKVALPCLRRSVTVEALVRAI